MIKDKLKSITNKYKADFDSAMTNKNHELYNFGKWEKYCMMLNNFQDELTKTKSPIELIQNEINDFAKYPESYPEEDEKLDL